MSYVTNIIISVDYEDPETIELIENFEWEFTDTGPRTIGKLNDISKTVDGTHHSCGHLYNTGLNYFDWDEFFDYLRDIKWSNPAGVVVILRSESGHTLVWRPIE